MDLQHRADLRKEQEGVRQRRHHGLRGGQLRALRRRQHLGGEEEEVASMVWSGPRDFKGLFLYAVAAVGIPELLPVGGEPVVPVQGDVVVLRRRTGPRGGGRARRRTGMKHEGEASCQQPLHRVLRSRHYYDSRRISRVIMLHQPSTLYKPSSLTFPPPPVNMLIMFVAVTL